LPCYTEKRLNSLRSAVQSLQAQTLPPHRVVVVVDNNPRLATDLQREFDWVKVVLNDGEPGASATRNRGVDAVDTALTAFLDDDETAHPQWLAQLIAPFSDCDVVGTGGKYEPNWLVPRPSWFADEFAWAVGGSYLGLPTQTAPIRNVWSGNMAVRTAEFRRAGGFRTQFGKKGAASQPEDTDLCIRVSAMTGKRWMYVPSAVVFHEVPEERASFSFFLSRCFSEGAGKALMQLNLQTDDAVDTEHAYVRDVARAALRRLAQIRPTAVVQGLVMLLGLASAGLGYLRERFVTPAIRRSSHR
jgi:GT2 family glycosyltransferase